MNSYDRHKERDRNDRWHIDPIENATYIPRWTLCMNAHIHKNYASLAGYWEYASATNAVQREHASFFIQQYLLKEAVKNHCKEEFNDEGGEILNAARTQTRARLNQALSTRANRLAYYTHSFLFY